MYVAVWVLPLGACISASAADHTLGNSVGAIGWLVACSGVGSAQGYVQAERGLDPLRLCNNPVRPSGRSRPLEPCGESGPVKIVTWLILPVVICLSQRLSHACLSISKLYCETANGSAAI